MFPSSVGGLFIYLIRIKTFSNNNLNSELYVLIVSINRITPYLSSLLLKYIMHYVTENFKTSRITQLWVHYYLCLIYNLNNIIISVLQLLVGWLLNFLFTIWMFSYKITHIIFRFYHIYWFYHSLFLIKIVRSHNIFWLGNYKISGLTQQWVHYCLFIFCDLNNFIVSVLHLPVVGLFNFLFPNRTFSYQNSSLYVLFILILLMW